MAAAGITNRCRVRGVAKASGISQGAAIGDTFVTCVVVRGVTRSFVIIPRTSKSPRQGVPPIWKGSVVPWAEGTGRLFYVSPGPNARLTG